MLKSLLVTACGLVTSVLTAIALEVIERLTGFSLFTFSFWVVIPVGAILCGFAAASGYWLGCRWLHVRPGGLLALQMVLVAGATYLLIYYLQYATYALEDGRMLSEVMEFPAFLKIALTSAQYQFGHAGSGTVEVGRFGYWLGGLQFIGFLVGGLAVQGLLAGKPYCDGCRKYLGVVVKAEQHFATAAEAASRAQAVAAIDPSQAGFTDLCRTVAGKGAEGSGRVTIELFECPGCFDQRVRVAAHQHVRKEWKDLGNAQTVKVQRGVDLRPAFGLVSRRSGRGARVAAR